MSIQQITGIAARRVQNGTGQFTNSVTGDN